MSARAIRQRIESTNDIENAFDSITYQKGAGVLSMFERWAGPEVFQRGVHDYLLQHKLGSGTADEFLDAESSATGKDVKTPFRSFLDQPGVPFIEAEVLCDAKKPRIHFHQSRFLPVGSTGDANKTWQVPVCTRYRAAGQTKEACMLLDHADGDESLGGRVSRTGCSRTPTPPGTSASRSPRQTWRSSARRGSASCRRASSSRSATACAPGSTAALSR